MSRAAALRFPIDPRMIPPEKVARRLGVTIAVFQDRRAALEADGFPKSDPVLGNYCLEAVDRWIDARSGLTRTAMGGPDHSEIEQRIRNQEWAW